MTATHRTHVAHRRRVEVHPADLRVAVQHALNHGQVMTDAERAAYTALGLACGIDFAGLYAAAHEGAKVVDGERGLADVEPYRPEGQE